MIEEISDDDFNRKLGMNPEDDETLHTMTDEEVQSLRNTIEWSIRDFADKPELMVVCGEIPWKYFSTLSNSTYVYTQKNMEKFHCEYACYIEHSNLCIPQLVGMFKKCVENKKNLMVFTTQMDLIPILGKLAYFNQYGIWWIHRDHDRRVVATEEYMEKIFKCSNLSIDYCDTMCVKDFCFRQVLDEPKKEENNGTEGNC